MLAARSPPVSDSATPSVHPSSPSRATTHSASLVAARRRIRRPSTLARFGTAVVVKGGHGAGPESADVLIWQGAEHWFRLPRVAAAQTHGTGCTFSAAMAAHLALGRSLVEAVWEAKRFVARALARALRTGRQRPLGFREAAGNLEPS